MVPIHSLYICSQVATCFFASSSRWSSSAIRCSCSFLIPSKAFWRRGSGKSGDKDSFSLDNLVVRVSRLRRDSSFRRDRRWTNPKLDREPWRSRSIVVVDRLLFIFTSFAVRSSSLLFFSSVNSSVSWRFLFFSISTSRRRSRHVEHEPEPFVDLRSESRSFSSSSHLSQGLIFSGRVNLTKRNVFFAREVRFSHWGTLVLTYSFSNFTTVVAFARRSSSSFVLYSTIWRSS